MRNLLTAFRLPLRIMVHPASGFYDMKYEHEGRLSVALVNLVLFWISWCFQKQYLGFALRSDNPMLENSIVDLCVIVCFFVLVCVANWSVTTLTDGEGSLRDIAMAIGYSLTPMILCFIPATVLSRVLTQTESGFYTLFIGAAVVWFLCLLFMGIYTIHNYTVGKTLLTFLFTLAALLLIIFLIGLTLTILQQVFLFAKSVYLELYYRM